MTSRISNLFASPKAVELARTDLAFVRVCRAIIRQGMSLPRPKDVWLDWTVDDLPCVLPEMAKEAVAVLKEHGVSSSEWKS